MNNPLKYTHPSGWLKYYNIDGDWRETSYTTWYGVDWEGPSRRFVKDPFYEGVVIDMKHFLAALRYGEAMTDKNEDIQNRKGNIHSAYNPQDYYSNNLGLAFRSYLVEKYPLFGDQEITFIDIIYGTELVPSISYFFYNFLIRFNYEP